jgi:hypothetical protein
VKDTVEQRILKLQAKKASLAEGALSMSKQKLSEMRLEDLKMLFSSYWNPLETLFISCVEYNTSAPMSILTQSRTTAAAILHSHKPTNQTLHTNNARRNSRDLQYKLREFCTMRLHLLCSSSCSERRVDSPERLAHLQFITTFAREREIPVVRNLCSQYQSRANAKQTHQISRRQCNWRVELYGRANNASVKSTVVVRSIRAKSGIAVKSYSPNIVRANGGHPKLQTFSNHSRIQHVALHAFEGPRTQYTSAFVTHKQRRHLSQPSLPAKNHELPPCAAACKTHLDRDSRVDGQQFSSEVRAFQYLPFESNR